MVLPLDADDELIKEDIAEVGTTNAVILQKIKRANEDATGEMRDLFLNNVDFTITLPDFYVQIVSKYATALFWLKSNGTDASLQQAVDIYKLAEKILIQRFQPVGSRVT
jgi:hypothetical protein